MRYISTGQRSVAIDVTSASWKLDEASNQRPIAIQCNASTTITGALIHDASETAWVLPAGVHFLAFRSVNTSSTTKNGYKVIFAE